MSERKVTVAAVQFSMVDKMEENFARAERGIREAAGKGARIILVPELFSGPYFCIEQVAAHFQLAQTLEDSPAVRHFSRLAGELGVVLPISFFEKSGSAFFNSLAVADATGTVLGVYRKSHIPDGPGYTEKFYFTPGDTGFHPWRTQAGVNIGVGICWDQWFPETARSFALRGAEALFYPTAIGTEPQDATIDSSGHWERVMCGHAGANMAPLVAANRWGVEKGAVSKYEIKFHGRSFIADETGAVVARAPADADAVLVHTFDFDAIARARASWGMFRDRRPELYTPLLTFDGSHVSAAARHPPARV